MATRTVDFSKLEIPQTVSDAALKAFASAVVPQASLIHAAYLSGGIAAAKQAHEDMQTANPAGLIAAVAAKIGQATEASITSVEEQGPTKIAVQNIETNEIKR